MADIDMTELGEALKRKYKDAFHDKDWKLIWDAAKALHEERTYSGTVGATPAE